MSKRKPNKLSKFFGISSKEDAEPTRQAAYIDALLDSAVTRTTRAVQVPEKVDVYAGSGPLISAIVVEDTDLHGSIRQCGVSPGCASSF